MDKVQITETHWAGRLLIASGLLTIGLMSQHPEGGHDGLMIPLVHGGLQAVIVVQLAAMVIGMGRFGWSLWVMAGILFVGAGQLAALGAATINGFVVPAFFSHPQGEIGAEIGQFAWEINQALARLGVIATGIGFTLWAVVLWRNARRALALAGALAGLVPALLLASGHIGMNLHGALFVYLTQALWVIALGWTFARWQPDAA